MTITEEDRTHINQIFSHLRTAEQWMNEEPLHVQSGSSMATDNARTDPHQLGHAVLFTLGVAVDHLHSMRMALTGAGDGKLGLHTFAPFTLTRGALENASTAVWLLTGASRTERYTRLLRREWWSVKNLAELLKEAGYPEEQGIQRRFDRVTDIADRLYIPRTDLNKKPSYSEVVKAAGKCVDMQDGENNLLFVYWKLCSGVAHGDSGVLGLLEHEVLGTAEPGVSIVKLTAPSALLEAGTRAAVLLVDHARQLYSQRVVKHI
ncbi:hypothetical protein ABZU53_04815 [Micromonospora sp. NPDC005194]|uniref:hypothetical protein n=1 Tax=Micromonospora sp. NPDC005194 TaxID=3156870 RepID=UPI0033B282CD